MELELASKGHQEAHEVGGAPKGGHPRGQGVGPLVFIFGEDFLLFIVRYSVEFQVISRTFVFCRITMVLFMCRANILRMT